LPASRRSRIVAPPADFDPAAAVAAHEATRVTERPSGAMNESADSAGEVERIVAWQCIGCGRVEGPQPCVGVCQDRKVTFVPAEAYDAAVTRMRRAEARLAALESLASRMALTKPRQGEWEKSYRALQDEARRAIRESRAAKAP
jgi:hypothetical protein